MLIDIYYPIILLGSLILILYFTKAAWKPYLAIWAADDPLEIPELSGITIRVDNIRLSDYQMGNLCSWFTSLGSQVHEESVRSITLTIPDNMAHAVTPDRLAVKLKGLAGVVTQYKSHTDNTVVFESDENQYILVTIIEQYVKIDSKENYV